MSFYNSFITDYANAKAKKIENYKITDIRLGKPVPRAVADMENLFTLKDGSVTKQSPYHFVRPVNIVLEDGSDRTTMVRCTLDVKDPKKLYMHSYQFNMCFNGITKKPMKLDPLKTVAYEGDCDE